jgi:hypothetical protein
MMLILEGLRLCQLEAVSMITLRRMDELTIGIKKANTICQMMRWVSRSFEEPV